MCTYSHAGTHAEHTVGIGLGLPDEYVDRDRLAEKELAQVVKYSEDSDLEVRF
jgi:hypothetical protein